jgi:hypothetical protein
MIREIGRNALLLLLFTFFAFSPTVFGQVLNDAIEQRLPLALAQLITSSTVGCTVQRTCVDEKLTGKCVEYHNDQWFEFTPPVAGKYFLNVSGQQCRDTRGVQLVVLSGKPCEVASYQILSCTSLGTQDDVFITLNYLEAGKTYLLNLDGYLHDQCTFLLELSSEPKGLPAFNAPLFSANTPSSRFCVLKWTLPDTIKAQQFKIMRRAASQFKSTQIGTVAAIRDTYGRLAPDYSFTDTLADSGDYLYQVVAEGNEMPVMLLQQWQRYRKVSGQSPVWLNLPLEKFPNGADIAILVTEPGSGRVLRKVRFMRKKKDPDQSKLLISNWQQQGIRRIEVKISWLKEGKPVESSETLVVLPEPE